MPETDPMENDDFFLGYCDIHSSTPRALFSRAHIERLHALAGLEVRVGSDFAAMHEAEAGPLIEKARERRQFTNCWTCSLSGDAYNNCYALTLDEDTDRPILDWLERAPLADDGTVPVDSDGCPRWEKR